MKTKFRSNINKIKDLTAQRQAARKADKGINGCGWIDGHDIGRRTDRRTEDRRTDIDRQI